jgi:hypothetical protein
MEESDGDDDGADLIDTDPMCFSMHDDSGAIDDESNEHIDPDVLLADSIRLFSSW